MAKNHVILMVNGAIQKISVKKFILSLEKDQPPMQSRTITKLHKGSANKRNNPLEKLIINKTMHSSVKYKLTTLIKYRFHFGTDCTLKIQRQSISKLTFIHLKQPFEMRNPSQNLIQSGTKTIFSDYREVQVGINSRIRRFPPIVQIGY